jgi:hypothetical protein
MGNPESEWGSSYRLIAAEKWKSKSAAMGRGVAGLLHSTGLLSVETEIKRRSRTWPGAAEELWEYAQAFSAPFRPSLRRIGSDRPIEFDAQLHAAVHPNEDGGRLKFEVGLRFASANKPGPAGMQTGKPCFPGVRVGSCA